jgi:hypothetical protein
MSAVGEGCVTSFLQTEWMCLVLMQWPSLCCALSQEKWTH